MLKTGYQLFTVVDLLIKLILTVLGSEHLVVAHAVGHLIAELFLGLLPHEVLTVRLADCISREVQQVHETLEDFGHLENSGL